MIYEEFQHLARLYVVGVLDEEEMEQFCAGRDAFGARAETFIRECRKLNSIFALSLHPMEPSPAIKAKLLERIRNNPRPKTNMDLSRLSVSRNHEHQVEVSVFGQKCAERN